MIVICQSVLLKAISESAFDKSIIDFSLLKLQPLFGSEIKLTHKKAPTHVDASRSSQFENVTSKPVAFTSGLQAYRPMRNVDTS